MAARSPHRLSSLHAIPGLLEKAGIPWDRAFRRAGIASRPGDDPLEVVCRAQLRTAAFTASSLLDDELLGLHYGRTVDLHHFGPPVLAPAASHNLEDGLNVLMRFMPSLQGGTTMALRVADDQAILSYDLPGDDREQNRIIFDAAISIIARVIGLFVGGRWLPSFIGLPHAGGRRRDYEDFFQAPVQLGAKSAWIAFDARLLRTTARQLQMGGATDWEAEGLRRFPDECDLSDEELPTVLGRIIDGMMALDAISFVDAAKTMGLAPRTLQRDLGRLGVSFQELLEERRRAAARKLLADSCLRITDVAMMLGYSDNANFTRAFRRWYRQSPTEFRRAGFGEQCDVLGAR
jgi:AraC-like DNA-binding protein